MGSLNRIPAGEALVEGADQVLVADGSVLLHAEAAAGLQGHKAVQSSPHHTGGVHGVIAGQAVAGEDCENHLQYSPAEFRTLVLTWARCRDGGGVASWVRTGIGAVSEGDLPQSIRPGPPNGGGGEHVPQLGQGEKADASAEVIE